jgi:hypothetical protein
MSDPIDDPVVREILSQLDRVAKESRSIRQRIHDVQARKPEWPNRRDPADLFDSVQPEYDADAPPRGDDEK